MAATWQAEVYDGPVPFPAFWERVVVDGFATIPVDPTTVATHCLTLLLVYAYIKEQLTFHFIWALSPSILYVVLHFSKFCKH